MNPKRSRNGRIDIDRLLRSLPEPAASPPRLAPPPKHPLALFLRWLRQAIRLGAPFPHAVALATADRRGRPSARVVLLRSLDRRGLIFYTDYRSRKGKEMEANPWAAMVFHWAELGRQVRVAGPVEKVSPEESDEYFRSRPRAHQLASWVSAQSRPLADPGILARKLEELRVKLRGRPVPRPPYWGGYRLVAKEMEFWQRGKNRLHERVRYRWRPPVWKVERLQP